MVGREEERAAARGTFRVYTARHANVLGGDGEMTWRDGGSRTRAPESRLPVLYPSFGYLVCWDEDSRRRERCR
jgi:hypothetical protein